MTEKKEEEKPMTEGYYLEAMEQLKEKYDLNEYLMKKMEMSLTETKKELCTAYGMVRVLDNMIGKSYRVDSDIITLSESLRSHLSAVFEDMI
jgi:hypothetical protein